MYGSVCWGGNISKFDRGRLEKIVKKNPTGHVVGMPSDSFKTLYAKRPFKKLMQILNDPHTQGDTTLIAEAATGVEDVYSLKQIQTVIRPRSTLCSVSF